MRILVVTSYYRPDGGAAAALFPPLCEGLARLGHEVTVLTSVPHYPSGRVPVDHRVRHVKRSSEKGVHVIRVPLPSIDRSKLPLRMFQFLSFQIISTIAGFNQKYDIFLTHSPALEEWLPFAYFSVFRRKPAVYSVHDLYPDGGIKLGIFRYKPIAWLVGALEKFCLRRADKVRVLSQSFIHNIQAKGVPESKLQLIYDWIEIDGFKPIPRHNPFAIEHNLVDKFVVMYAGNLGSIQGLESVLEAAEILKGNIRIHFVFVGDGGARESLISNAKQLGISNVQFIPYQPRERMPEVLATADTSLVTLRKGTGFGALPSKTFSILASERPIIASVDPGSDTWSIVERSRAGICIPPEEPPRLVESILKLETNPELCNKFGENGRKYVQQYHSPEYASITFEKLFLEVLDHKH